MGCQKTAIACFEVLSRNSPAEAEGKSVKISLYLSGLSVPYLSLSDGSHLPRSFHFFTDGARKTILTEVLTSWAREGPVLSCPVLSCPALPSPVLSCPDLPFPALPLLPVFRSCKSLHFLKLSYVIGNILFSGFEPQKVAQRRLPPPLPERDTDTSEPVKVLSQNGKPLSLGTVAIEVSDFRITRPALLSVCRWHLPHFCALRQLFGWPVG